MPSTRLSITIPDDLAMRLEPYRDRMNISKVCTLAIAEEIAMLDKAMPKTERAYLEGYRWGALWINENPEALEADDFRANLSGLVRSARVGLPVYSMLPAEWREFAGNPYTFEKESSPIDKPLPNGVRSWGRSKESQEATTFAKGWIQALQTARKHRTKAKPAKEKV